LLWIQNYGPWNHEYTSPNNDQKVLQIIGKRHSNLDVSLLYENKKNFIWFLCFWVLWPWTIHLNSLNIHSNGTKDVKSREFPSKLPSDRNYTFCCLRSWAVGLHCRFWTMQQMYEPVIYNKSSIHILLVLLHWKNLTNTTAN
jgi:hypothetical protein